MANYKVLFLDIDGTILRADHTIEDSTKIAIKAAKANNIEVFLATGRPIHEIKEIGKELDVHSYIGYNGAYAIYQDDIIVNEPMSSSIIEHYLDVARTHHHDMILYTNKLNLLTSTEGDIIEHFLDYFDIHQAQIYEEKYKQDILGITIMNVKPDEPVLYDLEEEDIYFSQVNVDGLRHSYDVIRENVNKGSAIKQVLERLNIAKEDAIAFGDGMNDKQMLSYVGHGFAMGNANPELFPYAKYKTTSVDNAGIYNGLKQLGIVKED
jgi:Cof subfamily protein (haloacid dehalogenase superfamily)